MQQKAGSSPSGSSSESEITPTSIFSAAVAWGFFAAGAGSCLRRLPSGWIRGWMCGPFKTLVNGPEREPRSERQSRLLYQNLVRISSSLLEVSSPPQRPCCFQSNTTTPPPHAVSGIWVISYFGPLWDDILYIDWTYVEDYWM